MNALPPSLSASLEEVEADTTLIHFTKPQVALTEVNAAALTKLLHRLAELVHGRRLVLDCSNVTLVSAAGLALSPAHKALQANGRCLALRNLNEAVYEVFAVTALTSLFDVQRAAPSAERE